MHFYFAFNQISYKRWFSTAPIYYVSVTYLICDFKNKIRRHDFNKTINIYIIIKRFIDMNMCIYIFIFLTLNIG